MGTLNVKLANATVAVAFAIAASPHLAAMDGAVGKQADRFETGKGPLEIVFLGHASLAMEFAGKRIHIDPVASNTEYGKWEDADLILVTHEHSDHMDRKAIEALSGPGTRIVAPDAARRKLGKGEALGHGMRLEAAGIGIEAVPAYNTSSGKTGYHPKERGDNGYVLSVGGLRIYVAGDTEPVPEMEKLSGIDIAFIPMNQPYTMTPEQVADTTRTIRPKILYPYHYSGTDPKRLTSLLANEKEIEVRIRDLQ